jgi:hypothetical protein
LIFVFDKLVLNCVATTTALWQCPFQVLGAVVLVFVFSIKAMLWARTRTQCSVKPFSKFMITARTPMALNAFASVVVIVWVIGIIAH